MATLHKQTIKEKFQNYKKNIKYRFERQ